MASGQVAVVYRQIGRLFRSGTVAGLSEGQLLDRFVARRDDEAFQAIVARHGPMVLSVCRSILRDPNDVDDAFQAVFLILVRRADSLCRRDLLGGWLHGVARRVARRALAEARHRHEREGTGPEPADKSIPLDDGLDTRPMLHEEVNRLPDSYREAVVLCYFQGRTHEEAAQELGWPVGTVKGRLARARDLLRDRLTRRGLAVPSAAVAVALAREGHAAVAPILISSTTKTAMALASGPLAAGLASSAHAISPRVIALSQGVLQAMSVTKLKLAATLIVAAGILSSPAVSAVQFVGPPQGGGKAIAKAGFAADPKTEPSATHRIAKEQEKIAEKAIKTLGEAWKTPNTRYDVTALLRWERRLLDARIEAGVPRAEAVGSFLAAINTVETTAKELSRGESAFITAADLAEAEFQRIEAEKLLANLKNTQPPDAIGPGAGVGKGFGGFAPSPVVVDAAFGGGGLSGDTTRTLPNMHPADAERNKIVEQALEREVTLSFPKGTPLDEILKYIRLHTKDAPTRLPNGVPIYIDPLVLVDEDADPPAPKPFLTRVPIEFEGIPLRVSLRLILDQFDLGYQVRDRLVYVMATDRLNFVSEGAREFLEATGGRPIVGGMGGGRGGMGGMGGMGGGMRGMGGGMPGMGGGMGGMGGGTGMPGTPKPGGTIK